MAISFNPTNETGSPDEYLSPELARELLDFPNPHQISVEGRRTLMSNLLQIYGRFPSDTRFHSAIIRLSEEQMSFADVQLAARYAVAGEEGERSPEASGRSQYNRLIGAAQALGHDGEDLSRRSLWE